MAWDCLRFEHLCTVPGLGGPYLRRFSGSFPAFCSWEAFASCCLCILFSWPAMGTKHYSATCPLSCPWHLPCLRRDRRGLISHCLGDFFTMDGFTGEQAGTAFLGCPQGRRPSTRLTLRTWRGERGVACILPPRSQVACLPGFCLDYLRQAFLCRTDYRRLSRHSANCTRRDYTCRLAGKFRLPDCAS